MEEFLARKYQWIDGKAFTILVNCVNGTERNTMVKIKKQPKPPPQKTTTYHAAVQMDGIWNFILFQYMYSSKNLFVFIVFF